MAGVDGCDRWRRLCVGRPGTGVYGRIDRVYQDRHHHLSHDNHAVGGCDECAVVAEGGTPDRANSKKSALRRLLSNSSNQQIGQMTQRPTESGVERLPTGVSGDFRCQSGKQTFESFGVVTLQGEKILQLVYDPSMSCRFPAAQRRVSSGHARRARSCGVAATSASCSCIQCLSYSMDEKPLSARNES